MSPGINLARHVRAPRDCTLCGLRTKSALALVLACLVALVPAGLLGWKLLETVRHSFGEAFTENYTRLNRERILAPISRDLALSMRLAGSEFTRQWLLDEENPDKRALFFREAEGYRQEFRDASYFLISTLNGHYYFNSADQTFSDQPRYTLDPDAPKDAWFFNTLKQAAPYNINVNPDVKLGTTRVWLNVLVMADGRRIGLAGTGLDLSGFLKRFIQTRPAGVTPMILDRNGAIQAHPDPDLISFGSTTLGGAAAHTLAEQLPDNRQRERLAQAMEAASAVTDSVPRLSVNLDDREQLLALAYIPELRWYLVTAVDLSVASLIQPAWLWGGLLAVALVLLVLLMGFALAVERILLRPLHDLQQSATAMSEGRYDVQLPRHGQDEIGDLTRAFERMAEQVKSHTDQLEARVEERTARLQRANREMAQVQRQIQDSIDYASLIQRAILPDQRMAERLGLDYFVLWRPRDVVGGDFYLFRQDGEGYLIGVVDCAGHGVPGALMTMLAHAALDQAINSLGIEAPAALLSRADAILRERLQGTEAAQAIATHMDAGLVFVDRRRGLLRYAGARISLYHSDGHEVNAIKGGRRALGDRRLGLLRRQ